MSLNLHKGARPDERFHLQTGKPMIKSVYQWWIFRFMTWGNIFEPDGSPARWWTLWIGKIQIYWGTSKCDATRTNMYWLHQLDNDEHDPHKYVMTTTPKEMFAFRWRKKGPKVYSWITAWMDMGGI